MVNLKGLPKVECEEHYRRAGLEVYKLGVGNKQLTVIIGDGQATCRIENIGEDRIQGATTAVYGAAREIMAETARRTGRDVFYTFSSTSAPMLYWATHQGRDIFHWNREGLVNEGVDGCELLVCRARIRAK